MFSEVKVPYGHDRELSVKIPSGNLLEVVHPNHVRPAASEMAEIGRAIDNPIGAPPLSEIVKPEHKVAIISDDITRPTPSDKILGVLLDRLEQYGVRPENITIIMALGSHRHMTADEMARKVGKDIFHKYRVVNSEFKKPEHLMDLGYAPDGVRILVSKTVMESDIRIGIGNIVPHPAMGWSGGGKIIYPGVTAESTVTQFHIQQGLADENMFGMDNGPIRLNVEKWVDTVGLHFIINTVLTPDFKIYRVAAGHYVHAQRKGVEYAKDVYGCRIKEKADIMLVSSYPVDIDLWQASKGYLCGERGLSEKGSVILVTPCYEGIGPHPEYADCVGDDSAEERLVRMKNGEKTKGDPLALAIGTCVSKIRRRKHLVIVTDGLTSEEANRAGLEYYSGSGLQQALDECMKRYEDPRVSVVTHGGETVLYI